MAHIYLLTDHRFVDPPEIDWYVQQILDEDDLLSKALLKHNITTERVDWADIDVDWTAGDAAIFRTTWDYFKRFDEFEKWFEQTRSLIRFINPPEQILWNLDKHYLNELKAKGIAVVPSSFIEKADAGSLSEHCEATRWDEFILKPCISAGGFHTYRIAKSEIPDQEELYRKLIQERSLMLQEFQPSIQKRGEVSHMVMGGRYTHSVLKKAKGEDFRVQDDFGGTVHGYKASEVEKSFAERVFHSCDPIPAYGRVDVMWDDMGELMVSELEIIEPELWFREFPPAAQVLADHLASIL